MTQPQRVTRALPGFTHINRYFDAHRQSQAAKILPGEYYVTCDDEVIVTVLGSCVSACIWDSTAGIGGMNHFMLPKSAEGRDNETRIANAGDAARYGTYAMEHLINTLLKHGGRRERLRTKIVGGGRVLAGSTDVGAKNIAFVREFLRNEGLAIAGEHVGGSWPRKVCFHPLSGRAQVKELKNMHNETISQREQTYQQQLGSTAKGGEVELF